MDATFQSVLTTTDGEHDMGGNHIPGEEMALLFEANNILSSTLLPITM
jgi:hypothetical protein